jgi:tetratricopeptide (TPR) repeat protein
MRWPFHSVLSSAEIDAIERRVIEAAQAGRDEEAWKALTPLLRAQRSQREAALCLADIVDQRCLSIDRAVQVLADVEQAHAGEAKILAAVGNALEGARDIDQLNSAPPEHPLFLSVLGRLETLAKASKGDELERFVLRGLATAARMVGRQRDDVAAESYRRLVELDPEDATKHYNYGLFLKTRGRFREGVEANSASARLRGEPNESTEWNLGICATGAGEARIALEVWKRMGHEIEIGRFGLPEGRYAQCKVRLAERPLAERTAATDDPGLEETIWIERLSPCHGIVRSVLYQSLGVDYGDVVLIDGAPITHHTYGEKRVPVFPHLATLVHNHYRLFDFAATQDDSGRIASISDELAEDAIVYSHSESFQTLCTHCWRDSGLDHEQHRPEQRHVVSGRIAAPKQLDPADLIAQIDRAIEMRSGCNLYAPGLCEAAGLQERATVERRRFELLKNNAAATG